MKSAKAKKTKKAKKTIKANDEKVEKVFNLGNFKITLYISNDGIVMISADKDNKEKQ